MPPHQEPRGGSRPLRHPIAHNDEAPLERSEIESEVRKILAQRAKLTTSIESIETASSLYDAGMTSHATVKVMLGLEDHFDVEFPDELLERSLFDQISSIVSAIEELLNDSYRPADSASEQENPCPLRRPA